MEHLTPAELLRFLEEEGHTLQLMNAKISDQLHCLQVEEEFFSRQLSDLDKENERSAIVLHGSCQMEQGFADTDNEDNFQNEIRSEGFERHSNALTDDTINSNPTLLEIPDTQNSSGADGQIYWTDVQPLREQSPEDCHEVYAEAGETTELERDHDMEDLQGQQQEQKVLTIKEPSPPQRISGRRVSRRPARLQD